MSVKIWEGGCGIPGGTDGRVIPGRWDSGERSAWGRGLSSCGLCGLPGSEREPVHALCVRRDLRQLASRGSLWPFMRAGPKETQANERGWLGGGSSHW